MAHVVTPPESVADADTPKEACGVFGVYSPSLPVAHLTYLGLYALQHRGQESAGMAVSDGDTLTVVKDMGLVSNAFEEEQPAPLLGMQKFLEQPKYADDLKKIKRLKVIYSHGYRRGHATSESETHGGFDNDPDTMNDVLKNVLGGRPKVKFTEDNLNY